MAHHFEPGTRASAIRDVRVDLRVDVRIPKRHGMQGGFFERRPAGAAKWLEVVRWLRAWQRIKHLFYA